MPQKNIRDMTDEEIGDLSPEELIAMQTGTADDDDKDDKKKGGKDAAADDNEEEEEESEEEESESEEEESEEESEEEEGEESEEESEEEESEESEEEEGEEVTPERLQALLDDLDGGGIEPGKDVPYSRFKKAIDRANDQSDVIRILLGQRGTAAATVQEEEPEPEKKFEYDFKAANREYHKLLSEGEDEKAQAKLDEIEDKREEQRQFDNERIRKTARTEVLGEVEARTAKEKMGEAMLVVFKEFPFLDHRAKTKNQDAIEATNAKVRNLIAAGKSPAEAVLEGGRAIGKVFAKALGLDAPKKKGEGAPDKKAGAEGAGDKKKGGKTKVEIDERTKGAVRRGLKVRQPTDTGKHGKGNGNDLSAVISAADLTDEKIDWLEKNDPDQLARLLGNDRVPG